MPAKQETTHPAEVPDEEMKHSTVEKTGVKMSTLQITLVMLAICCSTFLAALDVTIVTTALPTISDHFHSSSAYIWVGAAYILADGASTPVWGKVSDIWGRKPVLLIAIGIFFFGSALSAAAVSMKMLIGGRAVQGLGGGGLLTLSNIVVSDLFSMRDRSKYFGFIGMTWAFACSIGPLLGGALSQKASWRWCFYINLPCTAIVFAIVLWFLDLKTPTTPILAGLKALDWLGSLTVVGATVMLLLGLNYGGTTHPWASPIVICLIVFGVLTYVVFFIIEYKIAKSPIIPFVIFNTWNRVGPLLGCMLHGFVLVIALYFLPLYFQSILGTSALFSGVCLLPITVSLSFSAASTGWAISATGAYTIFIRAGFALMTLGSGLLIVLPHSRETGGDWARIIIFQIILGAGIGPNFQALLVALQTSVKMSDTGTAAATFGFARNLATSIGLVAAQVVFQNGMLKQDATLEASLGSTLAGTLANGGAESSVFQVDALPATQKDVARNVYYTSIRDVWYLQTAFAVVGLVCIWFIRGQELSREHQVIETGLEVEKLRADEAKQERLANRTGGQKEAI